MRRASSSFWDDILRFIATIKLKETTASDIFRRLNFYSKQHGLYHAGLFRFADTAHGFLICFLRSH